MPPMNIEVSACTRQMGSPSVNQRGPGEFQIRSCTAWNCGPAMRSRTALARAARAALIHQRVRPT